jgi:hypothetical protein
MAADFRRRIEVLIDFTTTGARKGMQSLRADVADADGVLGKARAGAAGLADTLGIGLGGAALAAGGALVTFGAKAVRAYTDTAEASAKLAAATGLSVADSSRWLEVAGDVGVEADALGAAFGRFTKAVGAGSPALEELGVEVARTADGTTDMQATLLAAVDALGRVRDPAQRARLATQLLGRQWAQLGELITTGGPALAEALAAVSDAKVMNDEDVASARELRDAWDELRGVAEDTALEVGGALAPALTDVLEVAGYLAQGVAAATDALGQLRDVANELLESTGGESDFGLGDFLTGSVVEWGREWVDSVRDVVDSNYDTAESAEEAAAATDDLGDTATDTAAEMDELERATALAAETAATAARTEDDLRRALDERWKAGRNAVDGAYEYRDALASWAGTIMDENRPALEELRDRTAEVAEKAADQAEAQAIANGETLTAAERHEIYVGELRRLRDMLGPDDPLRQYLTGYIRELEAIPETVTTVVSVTKLPSGPIVNENGDVRPGVPIAATSARSVTNVTVNVPAGVSGRGIGDEVETWARVGAAGG